MDPRDPLQVGAHLVHYASGQWLMPADIRSHTVILIHGFTSHGVYLEQLGEFIARHGFVSAIFNYNSYLGIDTAARELAELLSQLANELATHGFSIVGHSMGGLVARYFSQVAERALADSLNTLVLLGVPNKGALTGELLGYMLDWAESIGPANPYARMSSCRAANQLTMNDAEGLVGRINHSGAGGPHTKVLSISGGRDYLEFGQGRYTGALRNGIIQMLIGEKPNDGLVGESSADVTRVVRTPQTAIHRNNYAAYAQLNHTHLVRNQAIANMIVSWIRDNSRLPTNLTGPTGPSLPAQNVPMPPA